MESHNVLSYHDVALHESDVESLESMQWLTANLITFYLKYKNQISVFFLSINNKNSYLEYELYPSLKNNVLLVQPGTVQLIKSSEDEHLPIFFGEMNFVSPFFNNN